MLLHRTRTQQYHYSFVKAPMLCLGSVVYLKRLCDGRCEFFECSHVPTIAFNDLSALPTVSSWVIAEGGCDPRGGCGCLLTSQCSDDWPNIRVDHKYLLSHGYGTSLE